mmetsp:Transcript_18224/g.58951  ORF Transcript_18224/g.58951 Transcript_18224/m.58951 type:complete len:224 (-) Transcript_18224:909-1580(-)
MAYTASAVFTALALTFLGAAGTAVGGLLVVFQTDINFRRLGVLQGLAAGLMLCLSFVDLLPAAINIIGFPAANIWFFSGVAFFAAIVALIPEDSLGAGVVASSCEEDTPPSSPVEGKGGLMPPPLPTKGVKKERKQVMMSGAHSRPQHAKPLQAWRPDPQGVADRSGGAAALQGLSPPSASPSTTSQKASRYSWRPSRARTWGSAYGRRLSAPDNNLAPLGSG